MLPRELLDLSAAEVSELADRIVSSIQADPAIPSGMHGLTQGDTPAIEPARLVRATIDAIRSDEDPPLVLDPRELALVGSAAASLHFPLDQLMATTRIAGRATFEFLARRPSYAPTADDLVELSDRIWRHIEQSAHVIADAYNAQRNELVTGDKDERNRLLDCLIRKVATPEQFTAATRHLPTDRIEWARALLPTSRQRLEIESQLQARALFGEHHGDLIGMLPVQSPNDSVDLSPLTADTPVVIGPARPWSAFRESLQIARETRELAESSHEDNRQLLADDYLCQLATRAHPAAIDAIIDKHVHALLTYEDAQTSSRLLETLRVWLLNWGHRGRTSRDLFVHPQTVSYRMRQIETILGDVLDDPRVRLEMLIALTARESRATSLRGV